MPRLRNETLSASNLSWLDSAHGINNARTEQVNTSAFTAGTHYPNGFIPSGTPVAKVGGVMVPYTSAEGTTTNAGVLAGHLLTDVHIPAGSTANQPCAVLSHGRIKTAKVPQGTDAFTAPVAAAKRAATTIVYV